MNKLSTKPAIGQLISLMKAYGIDRVVLCPGSRNAPIVHSLAECGAMKCHAVTDERSAAFVAIGMADALQKPVAVCCTSGSALLNTVPAVAEAAHRRVPLLVISADRPQEWIGQMDGQTTVQPGCFGTLAESYNLPDGTDKQQYRNRLINEALARLTADGGGPVHINVPLDEPLFTFADAPLPEEREIEWERSSNIRLSANALEEWTSARRPMIIVGQMPPDDPAHAILSRLADENRCAILAEHLANWHHPNAISRFDRILAAEAAATSNLQPDLIIYVGGHIVSKRLKQFLRKARPRVAWHVAETDTAIDLFLSLTRMVRSCAAAVLAQLPVVADEGRRQFARAWSEAQASLPRPADGGWSELSAVGRVVGSIGDGCALALANSSAVRLAQHFGLPADTVVQCNRGINGIEGSLSAAVGFATASDRMTYCIIGDLSFFYDMNALWNVHLPKNLCVILLNNGGGAIFNTLQGLEQSAHLPIYVAARHRAQAEGWARSCGCFYAAASNRNELSAALHAVQSAAERRTAVIELFFQNDVENCS